MVLERWLSGRKRRFAKPLYGLNPVSRVRIPASPFSYTSPALDEQGFFYPFFLYIVETDGTSWKRLEVKKR